MSVMFKLAGVAASLILLPGTSVRAPAMAAAVQEDCPTVCYPDGSCSTECSSTAVVGVSPPIIDPPPTRQCTNFYYYAVPPHPQQCSVTTSFINSFGYRVYELRCCQ